MLKKILDDIDNTSLKKEFADKELEISLVDNVEIAKSYSKLMIVLESVSQIIEIGELMEYLAKFNQIEYCVVELEQRSVFKGDVIRKLNFLMNIYRGELVILLGYFQRIKGDEREEW